VSAEDLFEHAPCGYVTTALDGTIRRVNRTFEEWTGLRREELSGRRRFQDLLTAGGRIYHETHYAPLLRMQGAVREIALDLVHADGRRLPALVASVLHGDEVRTAVFEATDRRRYEQELLAARRREREIAIDLQRSLLAGALPEGVGVSYRPAVAGLQVGGDWYDAFWLDRPRTLGVVVGDVVGRGLDAAATMGQLRSAVRALASTDLRPGPLLDALDRYARRHEVGQMATVAYAEVDAAARRVRYACAGHPPPAVVEPDGAPAFAWGGRSLPLDAHTGTPPRPDAALDLPPGAALVLYTDGLIERSDRPVQSGLDALLATVASVRSEPPQALAAALTHRLAGRGDDVCVLALRLDGG
jgi:sigma-B regulation protein RsbU (phosphoserine phosphatase)